MRLDRQSGASLEFAITSGISPVNRITDRPRITASPVPSPPKIAAIYGSKTSPVSSQQRESDLPGIYSHQILILPLVSRMAEAQSPSPSALSLEASAQSLAALAQTSISPSQSLSALSESLSAWSQSLTQFFHAILRVCFILSPRTYLPKGQNGPFVDGYIFSQATTCILSTTASSWSLRS